MIWNERVGDLLVLRVTELQDSYNKYGYNDILEMHEAVSVDRVELIAGGNGLTWNYPWEGKVSDIKSGLIK